MELDAYLDVARAVVAEAAAMLQGAVAEEIRTKTDPRDLVTEWDTRCEDLIRAHKEAENIKLENQKTEASSVPWHPGAIKYFAEKGVKIGN